MRAVFHVAPPSGSLGDSLQVIADALTAINVVWIRAAKGRGLDPPCCTHCAAPPWLTRPVRYVPHHGAPHGTERQYLDGPTMFARHVGTCIDIAAYDAAAEIVKGRNARALVIGGPIDFHCVVEIDGVRSDPSLTIAQRQGHNVGGCGCRGES